MFRRTLVGTVVALAGALAILLACAGIASAGFDNRPVRLWSFSEVRQGVGKVRVAHGAQQGGLLHEHRTFGGAAFNFPESRPRNRANGDLFSTASGKRYAVWRRRRRSTRSSPGPRNGV